MAPQNSLPGSVDVINQKTGDVVAQYAKGSDRVVNLTDTSIVRVNASQESVNFFEREGNDLIVHMKDGSTVRYNSFFTVDGEGLHSEMIFEDELGTHQAAFPYAAAAGPAAAETIVPAFSDVSLGSLVGAGASGFSALAALGGLAAVGGIVGVAAAANNSGGGSNNNNNGGGDNGSGGGDNGNGGGDNGGGDNGGGETPVTPTLRINAIASDNIINLAESNEPQLLSGVTEAVNAGSTVTISANGQTWTTTVQEDGSWNVLLMPEDISAFGQGFHVLRFALFSFSGAVATADSEIMISTTPPVLELTPFTPGDILDQDQHVADKIVRGYVGAEDAGSTIFVTLNDRTYTAIANAEGQWELVIPAADMALLEDRQSYTLLYRAVDIAGNVSEETRAFSTNFNTPDITINPVATDNIINSAEILITQVLSGQTYNIPPGQLVTITLNGKTYYAEVMGDGSWKTSIPSGDLGLLPQGDSALTVSVNDADGNAIVRSVPINVDTTLTGVAIAILSTDDYLNASEAENPLEVRGVTTVFGEGVTIYVTVNGINYTVTSIDASGRWSVTIPSEDLLRLEDGANVITATVVLNDESAQDSRTLNVQVHRLPDPVMDAPFGDGYLNAAEKGVDQVLSGNTGVTSIGQRVTVQVAGKTYQATVDNDGTWKVTIPAGDLQTIPDGLVTVTVNASDAAGNTTPLTETAIVDTQFPALSLLPLTNDGKLNGAELGQDQILSGVSGVSEQGQTVAITLNGKTYTTVVGSDGNWQLPLPAADLSALQTGSYPLTVTLTDAAGNRTTVTQPISVKTGGVEIGVQALTDGNSLDAAEIKVDQILRGTSNAEEGSVVTVILNGVRYEGVTDIQGNWQVTLPAVELQKLGDGGQTLTVSVTDVFGQSSTIESPFSVDTTSDAVAINIIASDDYLNASEAADGLTIRGNSAGLPAGTVVTVTLNGVNYAATIQTDGSWQTAVDPAALQALTDGTQTVTATVSTSGGTLIDSHDFTVAINTLPNVTVDPAFIDNVVNIAEATQSQTLTGSTNISGAGQTVVATLNGQRFSGVVNLDGSWSITLPQGAMDLLAEGPGSLSVVATDMAGNSASSIVNFSVDKTPPSLSVTPINGTDVLNGNNIANGVTLSGTTSGDAASVVITLNGKSYPATITNGSWSVNLDNAALGGLANGASSWIVTATDNAGNVTTAIRTVSVDTTAPNVVMDPVARDNIIDLAEQNAGFSLSGRTVPAEPGATVAVTLNGQTLTGVVGGDGFWTIPVAPSVINSLTNGTYPISVTVTDSAGNASQPVSSTFTVDTTASAIAINPVDGDNRVSAADIADGLTISGTSVRIPEGNTITVTLNGVQYTATVTAGGSWQLTVPNADAAAIADGTVTLTVTGVDENNAVVSNELPFTLITHVLPQPVVNAPFGDGVVNAQEAAAGGNLAGNTGIAGAGQSVTISIDNGTPLTAQVDANGNWTLPLTPAQLGALTQGSHTVTVTATDAAGNTVSSSAPMTVDTVLPTFTIDDVTADNIINSAEAAGAVTITGTGVYDAQSAQTVIVLVNGQNYDAIIQPDGTWSVVLPAGALTGVPDGPVAVRVTVTDAAGNSSTQTDTFTLDASPANAPQVQIDKVAGDDFINRAEANGLSGVTISGTSQNVEAGQTLTVTLNGKNYPATINGDGRWSVTVPSGDLAQVPDGRQAISVTVNDVAGNSTISSHNVTFAAQPASQPTITLNPVAQDEVINALEHGQPLNISGSSTSLAAGTVITVLFNDKTYTGSVNSSGNWTITVPQADMQALQETENGTPYVVSASAVDAALNPASASSSVTVDLSAPTLAVDVANSFLSDGNINIADAAVDQTVRGTGTPGETVTLTLNGTTLSALVNEQGAWSMVIPAGSLQALPQGPSQITFVTTDAAGNSNPRIVDINVKTVDGPTLALDPMFGNNIVNISEAASESTLSGSASGLANGTPVVVTINGKEYIGEVNDGAWSAVIPQGSLNTSGQYTVTVTGADAFGNPATVNGNLDVVLTRPTATITEPLFGDDNILGQAEANAGVQLTGSTGQVGPGQSVSIILDNAEEFTGAVDNNGNWLVSLTPEQLIAITDGTHNVQISVTDRAGNTAVSDPVSVEIRTDPLPEPQLAPLFTDGILSATEAAGSQTLSGQLNLDPSRVASVTVSINNGTPLAATVNADGTWTLNVDSATLQALPDGVLPVTVTVTDTADNQATGQGSFEAIINALPQANYVTPFGDFTINSAETKSDQLITGNTGVTGTGQTVSVVLGTKTYTGTVNENGDWTVTVPQLDLAALSDNDSLAFSVTVRDRAGNTATTDAQQTPDVAVHTTVPAPTVTNPFGDGIVNISEAASEVTLTGLTGATGPNQYVTVKIDVDGVTYTANVDASGNWSVVLPAGTLQSLAPGAHQIAIYAEDQYGNSNTSTVDYQVALTPPSVTITAPVFADGYVSAAEAAAGTTLSGTFSTSYPANAQVKVTIGDQTFNATVNGNQWMLTTGAALPRAVSRASPSASRMARKTSELPASPPRCCSIRRRSA